ncbi:hypothetical protein B0I08_105103 [Glaciihabitans tibetensis]|uniref:Peptidase inhibitor family I36 n=1 Tax=Glaciihabitans tibetensis TaxID=1266600 RepID=A0A2T0VCN1_9MICO|nr:hypothetical protein [Glaciihabitans tibetensis]PRY67942.1 hypothetical protein B0I08_105103 [Glaciihabitans tibetensis]
MTAHTAPKRHRPLSVTFALLVGATVSLIPAVSATAATSAGASAPAQSCWEDVDTGETGCFDASLDVQEQIELVTGNPVVAVETGTGGERRVAPTSASSTAAAATYLLVTGWDDINMTGASKSYFTSSAIICDGGGYGYFNLGTFDNRFESIASYNGCSTTLYEKVDFEGTYTPYLTTSADLGAFKNWASSLDIE